MSRTSTTYDLGDSVKLTFVVRDAAGALTDATVAFTVTAPDGTLDTTAPDHPSLGTYTRTIAPNQAGLWLYRCVATGTATTADDGQFIVEANLAATLYTTVQEVRDQLGDVGTVAKLDAGQLEASIRAASRWIDERCGRRFWQDPIVSPRVYAPTDAWSAYIDDIATLTGLIVKTDTGGDGTYATTWTINTDFQLEPLNAAANGGAYAWWKLCALTQPFPTSWSARPRPVLQVTARWGWSQVPDQIREAATLTAVGLWKRRDAPFGVAGFGEFGAVRIRTDPDVERLIAPFMWHSGVA